MLTTSLIIQMVLLLGVPVAAGFWLNRRLGLSWILFMGGALAFAVSWIVSIFIPLPAQFGLLATSVIQMGALYLVFRYLLSTVSTEREALMVGMGQGGIELIILVVFLMLPTFTQMQTLRDAADEELISLAARSEGISEEEVEPSDLDEMRESIDEYWSTAWHRPLLQAIPFLSALPIQMALAVIVLSAWTQHTLRPLAGAIALHFLARIFVGVWGVIIWSSLSLVCGGIAVWFLRKLWPTIQEQTKTALKEQRKREKRAQRT